MTNPRDPEGLMPLADEAGPPVDGDGALALDEGARAGAQRDADLPMDGAAMDGGLARDRLGGDEGAATDALAGRTDLDAYGGDPDARFPGAEDPTMTSPVAERALTSAADDLDDGDVGDTRR